MASQRRRGRVRRARAARTTGHASAVSSARAIRPTYRYARRPTSSAARQDRQGGGRPEEPPRAGARALPRLRYSVGRSWGSCPRRSKGAPRSVELTGSWLRLNSVAQGSPGTGRRRSRTPASRGQSRRRARGGGALSLFVGMRRRESGCPRASRFTLGRSAAGTPARRSSSCASRPSRLASGIVASRSPKAEAHAAGGGSRPASTTRTPLGSTGTKRRRSQSSSSRSRSSVSTTSTLRSPSDASRSAASSTVAIGSSSTAARTVRKPRSVGSIVLASSWTTRGSAPARGRRTRAAASTSRRPPRRAPRRRAGRPPSSSSKRAPAPGRGRRGRRPARRGSAGGSAARSRPVGEYLGLVTAALAGYSGCPRCARPRSGVGSCRCGRSPRTELEWTDPPDEEKHEA